jgi:tetratricopeptide (TPR) repeat protein/tRNA A-37 threonylcarbamoyl transferase component Bud32
MTAAADRHLLFGLLALQNGLIDQGALVAAFQAWTRDKSRSLADHLEARGDLNGAKRAVLEALAGVHVETHGGDVEKSLTAVPANRSIRASLAELGEPEIEATLARVTRNNHGQATEMDDDPDCTSTLAVGGSTDDGQRFRLLRPHARGGLGEVFVALDRELHREVALKQILEQHADDPVSRQRFVVEAEVTGGLEHPGIVPVYGLGAYRNGRPYYAMRFIKGDSLKEAIEQFHADISLKNDPGRRSFELRKLLRRFLDICDAIDYAHSRGVIHRDIKPANIILGRHGETLVVDWGVAKAVGRADPSVGEQTIGPSSSGSSETMPGSALGTPAYMSPEQACGDLDRLGPRSDVYSLGSTLYCLLTGKPPFEGDDVGEILRKVQRGDFVPPRQLQPSLDAALDAVCLKAMAIQPGDRYPSCRALAEDVERWMADEPVSAWAEPWTRKMLRWLTRHRTGVTAAAAAVLAGVVGLTAVLAVEARANATLADKNSALTAANAKIEARYNLAVEAIKTFHTGVSADFMLKEEKFKDLRDRLLKSAADFYGKLGALLGKETDVASRQALAQSNFELAELTGKVGRNEDALAAHRAVLAAREALAAEPGAGALAKVDVGRSLIAVAGLLEATGKTDEPLASYRQSESLLAGPARADPSARAALANCRSRLGQLFSTMGKSAEALAAYKLARADQEALAAAPEVSNDARHDLADTINRIGNLLSNTGKSVEAEAEYRKALEIQQKLADDNPVVTEFRSSLADSHDSLGRLLPKTGKPAEAEAECRRALAIRRKLADANPAVTDFRRRLAESHNFLGNVLSNTGKPTDAEAEYRKALAIHQKLADENPAVTEFRKGLAWSHNDLGQVLSNTGKPAEAEAEWCKALEIQQKLADDNPAVTEFRSLLAWGHCGLGNLMSRTGKPAEAEAKYRKATALFQKLADDNASVTDFRSGLAYSHHGLGNVMSSTGKPAEAEAEYGKATALFQKLAADNPTVTDFRNCLAYSHYGLGNLMSSTGKPAEAEAEYGKATALFQKLAADNPTVTDFRSSLAYSHSQFATLLLNTGKPAEAEAEYGKAMALFQKLAADNPTVTDFRSSLAYSHSQFATLLLNTGKPAEAEAEYGKAMALDQKLVDDNPAVIDFRGDLALAYLRVASLQAWFGQDKELTSTCEKLLSLAKDTQDPALADRTAKCCSLRQADPKLRETALVLARRAVEHGKGSRWLVYFEMTLGMAEYRSGHFAEADAALTAAMNDPGKNNTVTSTSASYRAMGLFREGKTDLARKLATEAATKMKPLPVDEQKPLAGGADGDDLIMWLAYKEAKAMLKFEASPTGRTKD